jgi:ATP-dependent DNA ligase
MVSPARRRLGCRVVVAYLLLAAPVASAALFWGSWAWVAASAAVAVVEYATLQRSQRFSARVWRSVRVGRRSSRERATERLYVLTAVAGIALLAVAVLSAV